MTLDDPSREPARACPAVMMGRRKSAKRKSLTRAPHRRTTVNPMSQPSGHGGDEAPILLTSLQDQMHLRREHPRDRHLGLHPPCLGLHLPCHHHLHRSATILTSVGKNRIAKPGAFTSQRMSRRRGPPGARRPLKPAPRTSGVPPSRHCRRGARDGRAWGMRNGMGDQAKPAVEAQLEARGIQRAAVRAAAESFVGRERP